jgi:glutamate synthase (NADPH/NADH) large chain
MMIPEAWENHEDDGPGSAGVLRVPLDLMEPWDGPACVTFTDGTLIGAVLDRNGLRPGRYWVTDDGPGRPRLRGRRPRPRRPRRSCARAACSRAGCSSSTPRGPHHRGRGDQVPTRRRAAVRGVAPRRSAPPRRPARPRAHRAHAAASVRRRQQTFGYTEEELRDHPGPDGPHRREALGSMGTDTPIAVLSEQAAAALRLLHPTVRPGHQPAAGRDPRGARHLARHELHRAGGQPARPTPAHARQVVLTSRSSTTTSSPRSSTSTPTATCPAYATAVVKGLYDVNGGEAALGAARRDLRRGQSAAIDEGARIVVLSDRDSDRDLAPIPSLLLTSAVHHHLIREKTRTQVGLIVEAGDVREVHHVALLIGYGAAAVNPYLAMESVEDLVRSGAVTGVTQEKAVKNLIKALGKGVLKVMSKMGISTVASYRGAQVFEAIGLSQELVDRYFTGTVSQLGGSASTSSPRRWRLRHAAAYPPDGVRPAAPQARRSAASTSGAARGEPHLFDPETVFRCSTRRATGATTSSSSTPSGSTSSRAADDPSRAVRAAPRPRAHRRSRRSSRSVRSSSASTPAR